MSLFDKLFGSKQKSTTTTSPYAPTMPLINQGVSLFGDWMNSPAATSVYGGPRVADMSRDTLAAMEAARTSKGVNDAYGFFSGVMDGTPNSYTDALSDAVTRRVMPSVNAQFSLAGMTGGSQHQGIMTRELTDSLAPILYQAWEADQGRRMTAASALPGLDQQRIANLSNVGQMQDSYSQAKIDANRQAWEENRAAPIRGFSEIAPSLFNMAQLGGTSSSSTKNSQGLGSSIVGGLMAGASLFNPLVTGVSALASGVKNMSQGAPWSFGSSWTPWVQGA